MRLARRNELWWVKYIESSPTKCRILHNDLDDITTALVEAKCLGKYGWTINIHDAIGRFDYSDYLDTNTNYWAVEKIRPAEKLVPNTEFFRRLYPNGTIEGNFLVVEE